MFNKVIIAGNLTRDIEIRYTQSGSAIGNTGIASTKKYKSATGEQKEDVLFVDLTFFGRTAEIANQYLRKGSKILIEGRLKLDQWTGQDGVKRSKHSVIVENMTMLGSKQDSAGGGQAQYHQPPQDNYQYQQGGTSAPQTQQQQPPQSSAPAATQASPKPPLPEVDPNNEIPF